MSSVSGTISTAVGSVHASRLGTSYTKGLVNSVKDKEILNPFIFGMPVQQWHMHVSCKQEILPSLFGTKQRRAFSLL